MVIQHGISGGAGDNYIKELVYDLNKAGFCAVVMVQRGHESNVLTTPTLYNLTSAVDIEYCLKYINKLFHKPNLYGIGCSQGGCLQLCFSTI